MAKPFPQDVQWSFQPTGTFASFDSGVLQGRVYRQSGHIELSGPSLDGESAANLVRLAPPAVQTGQGALSIGGIIPSKALADGLELKQRLGAGVVTTRLTFPQDGVMRYEVTDWGAVVPLATAVAAPSD